MGKIAKLKDTVEITRTDDIYIVSYGQRNWRLSETAYNIICLIDGERNVAEVKDEIDKLTESNMPISIIEKIVSFLFENKLLEGTEEAENVQGKRNKFLWGRITLISEEIVKKANFLTVLFSPGLMIALGVVLLLWFGYLFLSNKILEIFEELYLMDIRTSLGIYVYIIAIALFHEFGHSVALMRGRQRPGRIGAAVYFIMPVLFSDVTAAWKLERKKRILVDFGGIYFQAICSFVLFVANSLFFKNYLLKFAILMSTVQIVSNLNPFLKLDGYWIVNDFFGTSDLHGLVKNAIFSLFTKKKVKEIQDMTKLRRMILYCYITATIGFMIYFARLLLISYINAYSILWNDFCHINEASFNVGNAIMYIGNNFTNFIVVFFSLRMLVFLLVKLVKKTYRGTYENN